MLDINELFRDEFSVLEEARAAAANATLPADACREELLVLALRYQRLIRESYRLISRSDRAERELNRINEQLQYVALILLDIDHFKRINDEHGHPMGDKVICSLVARIRRAVPDFAAIGRVGGEEFTILLPEARIEDAMITAGYIHASLNASPLDVLPGQLVTASIGVSLGSRGSDFESLYSAADTALYSAKHRGRNQVALDDAFFRDACDTRVVKIYSA